MAAAGFLQVVDGESPLPAGGANCAVLCNPPLKGKAFPSVVRGHCNCPFMVQYHNRTGNGSPSPVRHDPAIDGQKGIAGLWTRRLPGFLLRKGR
jgi:hypothetical protein